MKFEVSGSGTFLGCGNGNPTDHSKDRHPERCAYGGLCQVLAKAENAGKIYVRISSEGFEEINVMIEVTE